MNESTLHSINRGAQNSRLSADAGALRGRHATGATRWRRTGKMPGRQAGITLLELMVVLVIIGVLAVTAIPAYRGYTERAHRTEAKSALLTLAANQERWYLQNNTYTANLADLGFPGGLTEFGVYTLDFTVAPDTRRFTARARPTPGGGTNGVDQTRDTACQEFTLNEQGIRTAAPDTNDNCW